MATSQVSPPDTPGLDNIKTISIALSAFAVTLAALVWFFPSSLSPTFFLVVQVVALALPWVVVYMQARFPDLVNVSGDKTDPRPSLNLVILCPGFCMLANQFQNLQINAFSPLLEYACIPALLLGGALYLASPRGQSPISRFLVLFILASLYGYGVSLQADTLFDKSASREYAMHVVEKTYTSGRHTSYHLDLSSTDFSYGERAKVKHDFYDSVAVGSTVCVTMHDGALHVPWKTVQACQ